jgi:hypothetical protein
MAAADALHARYRAFSDLPRFAPLAFNVIPVYAGSDCAAPLSSNAQAAMVAIVLRIIRRFVIRVLPRGPIHRPTFSDIRQILCPLQISHILCP